MIRDQPEAPLIIVTPADRAETLLARARQSGARRIQLLVPDGITSLRDPAEVARLVAGALRADIELLLISSDPATLAAARQAGLMALTVSGTPVRAPRPGAPAAQKPPSAVGAPTLPLSESPADAPRPTPHAPRGSESPADAPRPTPHAPRADEADFLAALDALEAAPRSTPAEDVAAAEASLAAALSAPAAQPRPPLSDAELLAANLDREPGMTPLRSARPSAPTAHGPATPGPQAQRSVGTPAETQPLPVGRAPRAARTPQATAPPPDAPVQRRAPARAQRWPIIALTATLIGLLAIIAIVLLAGSRVTVVVSPPVRPETVEPVSDLPLPLTPPENTSDSAVAAAPLRDDVEFSLEGEVTEGTMTPSGSAGGTVTILNSSQQPILLPAATEFIALRADGQEVPFLSLGDVLVPASTTSDTGAQVITSRGQASVEVQARSPGSGSNVEGGTVRRVTPPGGVPFNVGAGGLLIQHGPLVGGSEEEVRIVKDSDVELLLAPTLEGMDSEARRRLDALARARGLVLDFSTITPSRAELEQLRGFEYLVQPAIGQSLDPSFPRFSLITRAQYSALATAPNRLLEQQLGVVLTEQLRQAGRLTPGDCRAPSVTGWQWDGESLLVDAQIIPDRLSPGCTGGLSQDVLDQVRAAVRGQSRAEAQAALDAMVAAGLIGDYSLPDVERLPTWDWQIEVQG
jgi:hypothetical protein